MTFNILALIATLIAIATLNRLINIFPILVNCMRRWKENVNVGNNLKIRNDRNLLAACMILPFGLMVFRYRLYDPEWFSIMSDEIRLLATIGIFLTYITARTILSLTWGPPKSRNETFRVAQYSSRTFFILLTLGFALIAGCSSLFKIPLIDTQNAMLWVSVAIYLIFLLIKSQILLSTYSFFASFLYLCALEILPTGVLVASAVIF